MKHKPTRSFRFDPVLLAKAKELGIDITAEMEKALSRIVLKHVDVCPLCKQKVEKPK